MTRSKRRVVALAIAAVSAAALAQEIGGSRQFKAESHPFETKFWRDGTAGLLKITVPDNGEPRIIFSSVRSTARLASIDALDPDGRVVWSMTGSATRLLGMEETQRPELGDVYRLQTIDGAKPGTWTVRFAGAPGEVGKVFGAYRVGPRFELLLPEAGPGIPDGTVGVPIALLVMPVDNGRPLVGLSGVSVLVEDNTDATIEQALAVSWVRTVHGVKIDLPIGQYAATVTLSRPGTYSLKAVHDFGPITVHAVRKLNVTR